MYPEEGEFKLKVDNLFEVVGNIAREWSSANYDFKIDHFDQDMWTDSIITATEELKKLIDDAANTAKSNFDLMKEMFTVVVAIKEIMNENGLHGRRSMTNVVDRHDVELKRILEKAKAVIQTNPIDEFLVGIDNILSVYARHVLTHSYDDRFKIFKTSAQVWIRCLKIVDDKTIYYVATNYSRKKGVDRIGGFIHRIWDRFRDNENVTFQEIFDAFNGEFQASKSSLIFNNGEPYYIDSNQPAVWDAIMRVTLVTTVIYYEFLQSSSWRQSSLFSACISASTTCIASNSSDILFQMWRKASMTARSITQMERRVTTRSAKKAATQMASSMQSGAMQHTAKTIRNEKKFIGGRMLLRAACLYICRQHLYSSNTDPLDGSRRVATRIGVAVGNLDREVHDVVANIADGMVHVVDLLRHDVNVANDSELFLGMGPVHGNRFVEARLQGGNRAFVDLLEVHVVLEICSELVARHPCENVVGHVG